MKQTIILSLIGFLAFALSQCTPEYYNCEGYRNSSTMEVPAKCLDYLNK